MNDRELLAKIKTRIPEFDAEQNDGSWIWTFRCQEQEEGSGSLIECFIDFTASQSEAIDASLGFDEEDEGYWVS